MVVNDKKDEYIAKIMHDLKVPINAQIIALESFLSTASDKISQEEKDLIELTLNSCSYMQKLTEIFNAVNKLNYESIKLNYEKFDILSLVKDSLDELKILIKYNELKIFFNCSKSIVVDADKLQIKRVIENLLSNSINYAFKNTTIKISLENVNGFAIFKIMNNSPYIEPEILKEIFQKYKTSASLYNKNGVGLGLYLSSEIMQAHHGEMIAESNMENFNIFGFKIPIS